MTILIKRKERNLDAVAFSTLEQAQEHMRSDVKATCQRGMSNYVQVNELSAWANVTENGYREEYDWRIMEFEDSDAKVSSAENKNALLFK